MKEEAMQAALEKIEYAPKRTKGPTCKVGDAETEVENM